MPDRFQRVVLLGEPGSGKSTCLRDIARTHLDRVETGLRLPIYSSLSEWTRTSVPALDFLRSRLALAIGSDSPLVRDFETHVADGRFIFLLDGLNELPGRRRALGPGLDAPGLLGPDVVRLRPISLDPRERSLRELAGTQGARCQFTLACRAHEYVDALQWRVFELDPIDEDDCDEFINECLTPDQAGGLKAGLRASPALRGIAGNPFFLQCLIGGYHPGALPVNRAEILAAVVPPNVVAGRVAFEMLRRGQIGGQAPIAASGPDVAAIDGLEASGLVIRRDRQRYFRHQIVQEFLAAVALRDTVVRPGLKRLLTDQRWSETIALWTDLDPARVQPRLTRALSARNLPWRRPTSGVTGPLSALYLSSTTAFVLIGLTYLLDAVFGPVHALASPVGYLPARPWQILIGLWLLRVAWKCLRFHEIVIANAAYVLTRGGRPEVVGPVVTAFARVSLPKQRNAIARAAATVGGAVLDDVLHGLRSPNWRVRTGCVIALGELLRLEPGHPRATDALVALTAVPDRDLAGPLVAGLTASGDERIPAALARLLDRESLSSPERSAIGRSLSRSSHRESPADGAVLDEFDRLLHTDRSPNVRSAAVQVLGWLAPPGAAERLQVAAEQDPMVRATAIRALGHVRAPEAVAALVLLTEREDSPEDELREAWFSIGATSSMPGLRVAAEHPLAAVRAHVAGALGAVGDDEALDLLERMAEDEEAEVRRAVARGLGRANRGDALPSLRRLTIDRSPRVRAAAVDVIDTAYPDLAPAELQRLADDVHYADRAAVAHRLARAARPAKGILARLHMRELRSLWRQERLARADGWDAFIHLTDRVTNDAELSRKFHLVLRLISVALSAGVLAITVVVLGLLRVGLVVLGFLIQHWVILVVAVVVLLVVFVSDKGAEKPPPLPIRRTFAILYAISLPMVTLALLGGLAWLWWCILLAVLVGWALWRIGLAARRRRVRPRIVAELVEV